MNRIIILLLLTAAFNLSFAQNGIKEKSKEDKIHNIEKISGISDRAGGLHNASNIGLFFENRGKLYPRRITQGPSGEFPINSGKHYIYRVNPMVGVPGNVVQARYTTNEEWEAVSGYHNQAGSRVAFSDNPKTWPATGWPVKDANGNPVIKSDQDSYCVYSDSTNSREQLGIVIAQTGYSYGVGFAKNLLFFKYEVINKGQKNLEGLYFNLYTDLDIGNISGGQPEYSDDKVGFIKDKNFMYFYDDGVSNEWPGGKTGQFGVVFLQTPEVNGRQLGITDFHYNLYDDDTDIDSIQYQIMSSSPVLYNSSYHDKFFHIGNNPDLHYDDPSTIPAAGLDMVANAASGPYTLNVGDTLTFLTAFVAGENNNELMYSLEQAYRILEYNFELSKPPVTPNLTAFTSDKKVTLYWDDIAETSLDNFSGEYDFEGFRLYKSLDKGVNWELISEYDVKNGIGIDAGIQYSYTDTNIINGLEYWYSVTAYDRGDSSVQSLETPRGNSPDAVNIVSVITSSNPLGRTPVSQGEIINSGTGNSNYTLQIQSADNESLANNNYEIGFTFVSRQEKGLPKVTAKMLVTDSSIIGVNKYGIEFINHNSFHLIDYSTDEYHLPDPKSYRNNATYSIIREPGKPAALSLQLFGPEPNAPADQLPKTGDLLTVSFGIYAVKNGTDTVIYPRPFEIDQLHSTSDGIVFKLTPPNPIQDVSRVGGTDNFEIQFSVGDELNLQDQTYLISVENRTVQNGDGFITLQIKNTEQEILTQIDSVYNLDVIEFFGLSGKVEFTPGNPPSPGNAISVTTILPKPIKLNDAYNFNLTPAKFDKQIVQQNISDIKVVPNPYIVSSIFEPEFGELRREPLRQIQFINLPGECTIHIFTVDADLVKTIYHNSNSGTAIWDLRSEGGREIAPGIYMYLIKTGNTEYLSRFAVIK